MSTTHTTRFLLTSQEKSAFRGGFKPGTRLFDHLLPPKPGKSQDGRFPWQGARLYVAGLGGMFACAIPSRYRAGF
jgi:hypothetical protein